MKLNDEKSFRLVIILCVGFLMMSMFMVLKWVNKQSHLLDGCERVCPEDKYLVSCHNGLNGFYFETTSIEDVKQILSLDENNVCSITPLIKRECLFYELRCE